MSVSACFTAAAIGSTTGTGMRLDTFAASPASGAPARMNRNDGRNVNHVATLAAADTSAATLGKLNIDLGLNARKIDFEGTINSTGQSASKTLSIYVPMIFAAVQVKPIDAFSIEAEVRGIAYSNSHYYDYIGRLRVNPIPLVFIAAGYRAETIKIDQSDVKADIKFGGPFVEAGLHF